MFGDVTSANIVGYAQDSTLDEYGFKHVTFTFDDVGNANKYSISNLKGDFVPGDNIQIFDGDGNILEQIEWKSRGSNSGWYYTIQSTTSAKEHQFDRGQSVWLSTGAPVDFTVSGEVNDKGMDVEIQDGYIFTQTGNPFPVAMKISCLTFDDSPVAGDNIQIFDADGNIEEQIEWKSRGSNSGWYYTIQSTSAAKDYAFEPGAAFWMSFGSATTMHIPTLAEVQAANVGE